MDSFLLKLSTPLFSLVCKYMVWFSRCGVVFWVFLEGGEEGRLPLFPCPLFSLSFFLGRGFPIYKPSRREHFNFKPQYNQPQAKPPPALAPERETFPPPLSLPKQAALQMDARGSPFSTPFASSLPVPARGKEGGAERRGIFWAGGEQDRAGRFDPEHHQSP